MFPGLIGFVGVLRLRHGIEEGVMGFVRDKLISIQRIGYLKQTTRS